MKNKSTSDLSKLYSVFVWPSNPQDREGKEYYENTKKFMQTLVGHPWLKSMMSKKKHIKILEVCGGSGFGGVALSRVLSEKGIKVSLLVTDLRKDALKIAKRWGSKVLGRKVNVSVTDVREVHKLREKYDLALIYGLSTPHFNPWDLVELFASVGEALKDDGLFIVDESDRRYRVFLNQGYKWTFLEGLGNKYMINFHSSYDLIKGTCKRVFVNLDKLSQKVPAEIFMWGLAEVGAVMWTFYRDVDMLTIGGTRHFILGYKPRKGLKPKDLNQPAVLKRLSDK